MSCKGCRESVIASDEAIDKLVHEQLQFETDIVDDDIYLLRLEACNNCSSLVYNTTCSHCGCFVQFRAKLAHKHCPYPKGTKW